MKDKLEKIFSAGLFMMSAAYVSVAMMATGCSSDNSGVTGGDTEEYSEVVESSSDEKTEVSSSSEKSEKVEKPSKKETPSSDSKGEVSSSSEEKLEQVESSSSEEKKSEPVETSSSSEESLNPGADSSSFDVADTNVDCSARPFPEDLMFLAGRGENDGPRFIRCDNDTVMVHWQIHHTTEEHVVTTPETYVISLSEDEWGADSLEYFKHDYLDKTEFNAYSEYDMSRASFVHSWRGYSYSDDEINCDASELSTDLHVTHYHYGYQSGAPSKDVYYTLTTYPLEEITVDENGNRTIRYGFTIDVDVYYRKEHYARLGIDVK